MVASESQIIKSDDETGFSTEQIINFTHDWFDLISKYNTALFAATVSSIKSFFNVYDAPVQKIQNAMRASFDSTLRRGLNDENFVSSIANFVEAGARLGDSTGYNILRNSFNDFYLHWNRLLEPLRDTVNRSQSEVIEMKGRFSLLHYKPVVERKQKTPLLVVYSLINRHYILDLIPNESVINNLLKQGFDIYATDWGTPDSFDKDLSLENFAHEYVENAVEKIKETTGSDKVSLFGYCWGGIFALIYSAFHPENVKNLILHATPIDIEKTTGVIENWTKHIDANLLVDSYGNVPAGFLNLAFILRNPVEALLKYGRYFSEPRSLDEITQFFAIETWLYDSVPIIGGVYKEIVNQIYKENLLIKNAMKVGSDLVDLQKITMPILNIIGSKDDLVPPHSSRSIMSVLPSEDKKLIEFPVGHVGLCVGQSAHEKLWPEVGKWLTHRS